MGRRVDGVSLGRTSLRAAAFQATEDESDGEDADDYSDTEDVEGDIVSSNNPSASHKLTTQEL